ncbi:hypothetical protein LEP1GSC021_2929 [Leptospira noguchii str. 1993005606]|nr:hypothetical protein LEP1GSC021_2929 [Leptospira noguchii str. 1993005606]
MLKNESPSVSSLRKQLIEAVLLIVIMEFFNNPNIKKSL